MLCHGSTPVATFDATLEKLWDGVRRDDLPAIAAIFGPLTDASESNCDDTLARDWLAWLSLATFEFPSALISTRLPVQALTQCSALMLTLMGEIDLRLGWTGAPREGRLASLEWAAQQSCMSILMADPVNPEVPLEELVAAGDELARIIPGLAEALVAATGWRLNI